MAQFGMRMKKTNSPHRSASSSEELSWCLLRSVWVEALLALFSVRGGFVEAERSKYEQSPCDSVDV